MTPLSSVKCTEFSAPHLLPIQLIKTAKGTILRMEPKISGAYMRGVKQKDEEAFSKATATTINNANPEHHDLWLYSFDHGREGFSWLNGTDILPMLPRPTWTHGLVPTHVWANRILSGRFLKMVYC